MQQQKPTKVVEKKRERRKGGKEKKKREEGRGFTSLIGATSLFYPLFHVSQRKSSSNLKLHGDGNIKKKKEAKGEVMMMSAKKREMKGERGK